MNRNAAGILAHTSTHRPAFPVYQWLIGAALRIHSNGLAQDSHLLPFSSAKAEPVFF